jgi:hypothetical protein
MDIEEGVVVVKGGGAIPNLVAAVSSVAPDIPVPCAVSGCSPVVMPAGLVPMAVDAVPLLIAIDLEIVDDRLVVRVPLIGDVGELVIVILPAIGPIRALRASWTPWRIRNGGAIADPGETIAREGGGAIGDGGESAGESGGTIGDGGKSAGEGGGAIGDGGEFAGESGGAVGYGREFAGESGGAVGGFEYQVIAAAGAFVGE